MNSAEMKKTTPSSSPTHNPPILSPSAIKSGGGNSTNIMMSLASSVSRNNVNVVSSPPNLAAFDNKTTGCDNKEEPKIISAASVHSSSKS